MEEGKCNVRTRRGAGSSSNVVACSPCPLQEKKTLQHIRPPPHFADQWCLEVRLPALLLVSTTDTQLVHDHGGYYTSQGKGGASWLKAVDVHLDFNHMLEGIQSRDELSVLYHSLPFSKDSITLRTCMAPPCVTLHRGWQVCSTVRYRHVASHRKL